MLERSGSAKFVSLALLLAMVGYAVYTLGAKSVCGKIERATAPLGLLASASMRLFDNDGGWTDYRLHASALLSRAVNAAEECDFVERHRRAIIEKTLEIDPRKVSDDEKRRILGAP